MPGVHAHGETMNCEITAVTDLVEDRRHRLVNAYGCSNAYPSLEVMLERAADAFESWIVNGPEDTMSRFNG